MTSSLATRSSLPLAITGYTIVAAFCLPPKFPWKNPIPPHAMDFHNKILALSWWPQSKPIITQPTRVFSDHSSNQPIGGFRKWCQIIHFNRVFHYKPSILGYPYFWKPPISSNQRYQWESYPAIFWASSRLHPENSRVFLPHDGIPWDDCMYLPAYTNLYFWHFMVTCMHNIPKKPKP